MVIDLVFTVPVLLPARSLFFVSVTLLIWSGPLGLPGRPMASTFLPFPDPLPIFLHLLFFSVCHGSFCNVYFASEMFLWSSAFLQSLRGKCWEQHVGTPWIQKYNPGWWRSTSPCWRRSQFEKVESEVVFVISFGDITSRIDTTYTKIVFDCARIV